MKTRVVPAASASGARPVQTLSTRHACWVPALLLVALSLGSAACKGKTVVKDNPRTKESLTQCESSLKEKVSYISTLSANITALESSGAGTGEGGEVVVMLKGEVMTIVAGKTKGPHTVTKDPKGNAKDAELYEAFVKQLRGSRGSIKKCYQHALKKNSALSSRTVSLKIAVQYRTSGKVRKTNFNPRVSQQFNQCMESVATKWKLPAMPKPVTFNYTQTMTPE